MKTSDVFVGLCSLVVAAMLGAVPAMADPVVENINGVSGRFENATCSGAYYMTMSAAERMEDPACEFKKPDGSEDLEANRICMINFLKKNAKPAPAAVLTVQAVTGTKEFMVNIVEDGRSVLSSRRIGYHGDAENGITLIFDRVGFTEGDKYSMEIGLVREGFADMASVPVNRRFLADRLYFFPNGCSLKWVE